MAVNEKALVYIFVFLIFALFSKITCRWLVELACRVSGIPFEKIIYQRQLKIVRKEEIPFNRWLLENSAEPEKVHRLLRAYKLCIIPGIFLTVISAVGLFTHTFDSFLDTASLVMTGANMLSFLLGTVIVSRYRS